MRSARLYNTASRLVVRFGSASRSRRIQANGLVLIRGVALLDDPALDVFASIAQVPANSSGGRTGVLVTPEI
jgi:hypothetical protein